MTHAGTFATAYGAASLTHYFFQGGEDVTLSKVLLVFGVRGAIALLSSRFPSHKPSLEKEKIVSLADKKEVREAFLNGKWRIPLLYGMFIAPVIEETIFRLPVVYYPSFNPLTAAVFGYLHKDPIVPVSSTLTVLHSAIAGATFGAVAISYGWWAGTLLHILNNMFSLAPIYVLLARNEEKIKEFVKEHIPESENP